MRRTPLIGDKAWFGPKRFGGWGWAPATWEGWAFTAVLFVVLGAVHRRAWVTVVVIAVAIAVVVLKGTSPGGGPEYKQLHPPQPTIRGGGDDTPSINGIVRNFEDHDESER